MPKTYTVEEFVRALINDELRTPVIRQGIVKPDPEGDETILFSPDLTSRQWVRLPLTLLEAVAHLATAPTQDGDYPYAQLTFKTSLDSAEAEALLELLRTERPTAPQISAATTPGLCFFGGTGEADRACRRVGDNGVATGSWRSYRCEFCQADPPLVSSDECLDCGINPITGRYLATFVLVTYS